ncbi:hypothetical protein GPROT1_01959 [Gammaproteobacteria bacterium]|nr:hypothetical protein GPROT1_01959 [Gammaproteobacteria bacterium]
MNRARQFTEREYQREIEPTFRKIFQCTASFGEMFTSNMVARAILFPVFPQLTLLEFQALSYAARAGGDPCAYLSLLDRIDDMNYVQHWQVSLESGEEYSNLKTANSVLENALYSPDGKWGIRLTLQRFAVVGGSLAFIETLFNQLSSSVEMHTLSFLAAYKVDPNYFGGDIGWLDGFLSELYGHEKSQALLSVAGLLS